MARKRVSFSISSDPDTVEGRVVDYLRNHNKMFNFREAIVRALKAYYLPWAYEDEVTKEESQVLARHAIDELEFRIFQIRRHFLAGEPYGSKLSTALDLGQSSSPAQQNGQAAASGETAETVETAETAETVLSNPDAAEVNPMSVPQMLEDVEIDPDVLDDF